MSLKQATKNTGSRGSWKDKALVLIVLIYSGNPALTILFSSELQFVLLAVFFFFLLNRRTGRIFSSNFTLIASIFAAILMLQCIEFSFYPFVTMAGFFTKLFIGYAAMRLVGDFPKVYVRVMVGLAILSFIFYVPYLFLSYAGINFEDMITQAATKLGTASSGRRYLLLHTFMGDFSPRNSGMFWEPGAFAGYLILGLIFLSIIKRKMNRKQYYRILLILCAAVLTTFSTTGYIALSFIPLLHYDWRTKTKKKTAAKIMLGIYVILPVIIGSSFVAYNKLPFLREKVEHQMYKVEMQEERWHMTRVGSLLFDWEYIKRRPLTGWGLHGSTRYSLHPHIEFLSGMGNGMSDFTAKFGITGMLIWLYFVFRALIHLTRQNLHKILLSLLIICLILQGEAFLGFPLFLGLMFLGEKQTVWKRRESRLSSIGVSDGVKAT